MGKIKRYLTDQVHIAPLAMFRVIFGMMMLGGVIRFIARGWVYELYVMPKYYFSYYGFEWVKPLGEAGMYTVFIVMGLAALFIMLGLFYRLAAIAFFILFTYVELIDKVNYLNHYYFISLVSFLLILVPADRFFSLDVVRNPSLRVTHIPRWMIGLFRVQLGVVYFYAGLAKLNYDWLFRAMPLKTWLAANSDFPIIGTYFDYEWVAYLFSWFGAFYDLTIPFFLLMNRTRKVAYLFVVIFHVMTAALFPIGMFPYIMILATLVFFPESFHISLIDKIRNLGRSKTIFQDQVQNFFSSHWFNKIIIPFLILFFVVQLASPFRYLLYPGKLFWTEQGYRFSWRVMLMEKAGTAFFYVRDPETGRQCEVMSSDYLTRQQEKMMSTQPDMILQFAHFIESEYKKIGIKDPEVRVESYVTLNGSGSRLYIDKTVDLTKEKENFLPKKWILPFAENQLSKK